MYQVVYCKMGSFIKICDNYYKMRRFYSKMQQLLQFQSVLRNASVQHAISQTIAHKPQYVLRILPKNWTKNITS